ncbi:MAG TPA: hypothetical protein VGD43_24215, partial [Micromonospora sp.]
MPVGALLAGQLLLFSGCGVPPELREPPLGALPSPTGPMSGPPTTAPPVVPTPTLAQPPVTPSPSGYPETTAVACHDGPTRRQVITLVRRASGLLG